LLPFSGGAEAPIPGAGLPLEAFWTDSVTVGLATQVPGGLRLTEADVRTGVQRNYLDVPDSTLTQAVPLSGGWAWIPRSNDRIMVEQGGHTRRIPMPSRYAAIVHVDHGSTDHQLMYGAYGGPQADSLIVGMVSLDDGSMTEWGRSFAEHGRVKRLADDGMLLEAAQTEDNITFFTIAGPGQLARLGATARPVRDVSVSSDLKHAVVSERDYRADAWMNQVVTH